jgi:RsiW-degrading membrane proteinase PrsW (M82 family)
MLQRTIIAINQKEIVIKSTIIGVITTLLSMFLFVNNALADGWAMPDTPPTGVPESFDNAILNLTNWILGFVAMIAVLAIVWGGVMYIASAGDETKATTGKRVVTYALIGLVIAGIAYALVNIVVTVILAPAPAPAL